MGHSRTLNWGSHCLLLLDFCRQSRSFGIRAEVPTVLPIADTRKRQNSISPNSEKPLWSEIKDQSSLCGFPFSDAEQISPSKVWAESPLLQQKQVNFLRMGLQVKPQPSHLLHLVKPRFTVEVPLLGTRGQGKRKTAALFLPFSQAHDLSFVFCPEEGGWRGRRKNEPENTIL